jgi:hypothetical protein
VEENSRILKSVRARLSTGIPCAFVTRDPDPNIFTDSDFEVIGQAYVPPRDFALPKGRKKINRKKSNERDVIAVSSQWLGRNDHLREQSVTGDNINKLGASCQSQYIC